MAEDYMHDDDVAALLDIPLRALRNKVARGDPLPPRIKLPNMRVRLWPRQGVVNWIQAAGGEVAEGEGRINRQNPGRTGRPRKARWVGQEK